MKRTFGKLISLALVLAMVLAMVPAVLAADPTPVEKTMGVGETFKVENPAATSWSVGSSSYVSVSYNKDYPTKATITANKSTTGTGTSASYGMVYAYSGSTKIAAYKITVKSAWKLSLSTTSLDLDAGKEAILTAKVEGPRLDSSDTTVSFSVDGLGITVTPTTAQTIDYGEVRATVKAGDAQAHGTVTATLSYKDANGDTQEKKENCEVSVQQGSYFKVTANKTKLQLKVNETATITATVSGAADNNNKEIKVTNSAPGVAYVRKGDKKNATTNIVITATTVGTATITLGVDGYDTATPATVEVNVIDKEATGLTVELKQDDSEKLSSMKFANVAKDNLSVKTFTLIPTVTANTAANIAAAKDRITWTSSNTKIATVEKQSDGSALVTAKGEAFGEVTITASLDTLKDQKYTIRCWEAVQYTPPETLTIGNSISDIYSTVSALEKQPISVRLPDKNKSATLYAKSFIPDYGTGTYEGLVRFKGTIDGIDGSNYIIYYPATGDGTVTTTYASISTVKIELQPQDATYKLNATIGKLTCSARTSGSTEYIQKVEWLDKNNNVVMTQNAKTSESGVGEIPYHATSFTSTLDLAGKITEAGTYTYRCVITSVTGTGTSAKTSTVESNTAIITIGGDYNVNITASATSVAPGSSITLSGVAQQYNPSTKKYVDVTKSHTIIWTLSDSSLAKLSASSSTNGRSVTLTAKSGGTLKVTGTVNIDGKDYTGTKEITIKVPTADSISLSIGEDDSYVQLDGSKIVDAVKAATKGSSSSGTTLSTIAFQNPSNGDIYTNSNTTTRITYASSSSVSSGARYSSSDVSKMVFKPSTRNVANYTLDYTAYTSDGELATGKIIITGQGGSVVYHISAGESVAMQESDFLTVLRNGSTSSAKLNYVRFGTVSDSRGALYKGSTTSSGTVGTSLDCYATGQGSTGAQQLKNVNFIAGTSTAKYTVTVPFTVYGTGGQTVQGNLIVYVNDTHTIPVTGSSFKDMQIGTELLPSNASTSSSYVTITSVISGKLYSRYAGITDNTPLKTSDFGSTKYYFSGTGSIDSLYILPVADAKTVTVNYTLYDGSTTTKSSLSFKVTQLSASRNFSDVSGSTSWAANSVDFMSTNKLVNGVSNTAFGPNQTMTRAMLVTILYRAAGSPSVTGITNKFTDNKQGQYYYDAVLWAANKGVVTGASATRFDPDGKVTREQIAAILYRYAGSPTGSSTSLNSFSDSGSVSSYAVAALQWAVGKGIITGISTNGRTTLSAKNNANRAQVAVMLHRFLTFD